MIWAIREKKHKAAQDISMEMLKITNDNYFKEDIDYHENSINFIRQLRTGQSSAKQHLAPVLQVGRVKP